MLKDTLRTCRRCGAAEPAEGFPRAKRLRCRRCWNAEHKEWLRLRKERVGRLNGEDLPCSDCPRWFRSLTALKVHRSGAHGVRVVQVGTIGDFACTYCPKVFASLRSVGTHIGRIHGRPPGRVLARNSAASKQKYRLKGEYGITPKDLAAMVERQGGKCGGCQSSARRLHIDHCHGDGVVRGLLCTQCNTSLGHARDDEVVLRRLVVYLSEPIPTLPDHEVPPCAECGRLLLTLRALGVHRRKSHGVPGAALRGDYRDSNLRRFGLKPGHFEYLLASQNHRCRGCTRTASEAHGDQRPLYVDHQHSSGAVRGLLCANCNFLIGKCGDDPVVLLGLVSYLEGWRGESQTRVEN